VQRHASTLAGLLRQVRLPLAPADSAEGAEAAALLAQLDDYVLPRLSTLDAPVLAVVGGSTGAGKSTLVNALVGRLVSMAGVLRPTTRHPVLVHHPADAAWFAGDGVLPGLARIEVSAEVAGAGPALVLVTDDAVPAGVALLDAPDVDSVVTQNRALAAQLLAAADLWLFVTSAARYADAVPWTLLVEAARRQVATAVVLDRVPPDAVGEVARDLASLMARRGLGGSPLFVVEEHALVDGRLPAQAVAPVRQWLDGLAASAAARDAVVRSTLTGALGEVAQRAHGLADVLDHQDGRLAALRSVVDDAYGAAFDRVATALGDGSLLRAEVLDRWRDLAGASDVSRTLEAWAGRVRRRLSLRADDVPPTAPVEAALTAGVRDVLVDAVDRAAAATDEGWRGLGAWALLEPPLPRSGDVRARAETSLQQWRDGVVDLVETQGGSKRGRARGVAAGINGVAVVLMVATFGATGGLTGAEVGIAAAAALASQKALVSVFGSRAVSALTDQVRDDLLQRVRGLLDEQRALADARLDDLAVPVGLGAAVRAEADGLDSQRHLVAR
jgi:energy-coupling factor transporter ATP-binding protein EcfA2